MLTRCEALKALKSQVFDIVVIGGGATGSSVALEAVSRGYSVALIEKNDYTSGASMKATKLLHGGVRYLEKAIKECSYPQYQLVKEALAERSYWLATTPRLSHTLEMIIPFKTLWEGGYSFLGMKLYEWLAGQKNIAPSRWLSEKKMLLKLPSLKKKKFLGAISYFDGQFDDVRANLYLLKQGGELGCVACNYLKASSFLEDSLCRINVEDCLSGEVFILQSRYVVNATGVDADHLRMKVNSSLKPIMKPSSGTHIVLEENLCSENVGLLIPKTEDGRVVFMLPWKGKTLIGTTDNGCLPEESLRPLEKEKQILCSYIQPYIDKDLSHQIISSSWKGLRPLVNQGMMMTTSRLSRSHHIEATSKHVWTLVGGKWTTTRKMASDLLNRMEKKTIEPQTIFEDDTFHQMLSHDVSLLTLTHLASCYGRDAQLILDLGKELLHEDYPYLVSEVIYTLRYEQVLHPEDFLMRRIGLSLQSQSDAIALLPRVCQVMSRYLDWNQEKTEKEERRARDYLMNQHSFTQ